MSGLSTVDQLLEKDCFCHYNELNYLFECMPSSIKTPNITENCGCYHDKSDQIRQALSQFKTFMETKSLFKVGDRVEIAVDLNLNWTDSPGWMSCRHFLVKGAVGTVQTIDYYNGEFGYLIQFDDDKTWIDDKDVIRPNSNQDKRHNFFFREAKLRKHGSNVTCEFLKKLWYDFYKVGD